MRFYRYIVIDKTSAFHQNNLLNHSKLIKVTPRIITKKTELKK